MKKAPMATDYIVIVGRRRKEIRAETPAEAARLAVEGLTGSGRRGRVKPCRIAEVDGQRLEVYSNEAGFTVIPL